MTPTTDAATVLLVDDSALVAQPLVRVLNGAGYAVTWCKHGGEALAYLQQTPTLPAVILLDLSMRGMNGWTFRQHQRRDRQLQTIPTVIISNTATPNLDDALAAEAYVPKSGDLDVLLATVARYAHPHASHRDGCRT